MPIDLLSWGFAAEITGLVFWPILKQLAERSAASMAADYIKGCFGSVFSPLRKDELQRALGPVLLELLQRIQDELLDAGIEEDQLTAWLPDVKGMGSDRL